MATTRELVNALIALDPDSDLVVVTDNDTTLQPVVPADFTIDYKYYCDAGTSIGTYVAALGDGETGDLRAILVIPAISPVA